MAYCPNCAAVLNGGASVCARCGRPVAVAGAAAVAGAVPRSVRMAGVLILVSCSCSLLSLAFTLITILHRGPPFFLLRSFGLLIVWTACAMFLWQRQNWARIVIAVLLLWSFGNLFLSLFRGTVAGALLWSLFVAMLINGLRLFAAYLIFRPESNAWFKGR